MDAGQAVVTAASTGTLKSTLNEKLSANMGNPPNITGASCTGYTSTDSNDDSSSETIVTAVPLSIGAALIVVAVIGSIIYLQKQKDAVQYTEAQDAVPIPEMDDHLHNSKGERDDGVGKAI